MRIISRSLINFWIPDFTDGAYVNVKNKGLYLISNSSLRDDITKLFEIEFNRLEDYILDFDFKYREQFVDPLLHNYFVRDWHDVEIQPEYIPKDYEELMNDEAFFTVLTEIRYRRIQRVERYQETIDKAKETSEFIQSEISKLKP